MTLYEYLHTETITLHTPDVKGSLKLIVSKIMSITDAVYNKPLT